MPFIAWMCPLLKQRTILETEIVYFEGDEITSIYFMKEGSCAFVLPKYDNAKYINITIGYHFGMEDFVGSIIKNEDIKQDDWLAKKEKLIRQFSVIGDDETGKSNIMCLGITDLNRMQAEFSDVYEAMFNESYKRLEYVLKEKLSSITQCADELKNLIESNQYEDSKNLISMKKHSFLTSYIELGDLAALCGQSDESEDEQAQQQNNIKKSLKRKASKHLQQKNAEKGSMMSDLIKNSLGSFFQKKITDTKDPSNKTEAQIKGEEHEEEISKSERYRRNVAKFVEMAKKGKDEREKIQKQEEHAKKQEEEVMKQPPLTKEEIYKKNVAVFVEKAKQMAEKKKREAEDAIAEEDLTQSQRYRRNVRRFVEAA